MRRGRVGCSGVNGSVLNRYAHIFLMEASDLIIPRSMNGRIEGVSDRLRRHTSMVIAQLHNFIRRLVSEGKIIFYRNFLNPSTYSRYPMLVPVRPLYFAPVASAIYVLSRRNIPIPILAVIFLSIINLIARIPLVQLLETLVSLNKSRKQQWPSHLHILFEAPFISELAQTPHLHCLHPV